MRPSRRDWTWRCRHTYDNNCCRASGFWPRCVTKRSIRTREDFDRLFKLPSPEDCGFVANARQFIAHKGDDCACACVRLGIGAKVVPVMEEIGFDVIWAFDDVAFNSGPVFQPEFYRQHILPKEKQVAATFSKPLITHSDGDMTPLLDCWLELGQTTIHPIQPDVMDIEAVKTRYGSRVALVGNIFMTDLVQQEPEQNEAQVRRRIEVIGRGGGYIISSSNSHTDDMKPQNVRAMAHAISAVRPIVAL